MTIAPDSLPKTAETLEQKPHSHLDAAAHPVDSPAQITDAEKAELLTERIAQLEKQLGKYALPFALGSIERAQAYFERARTVSNAKDVVPDADTSRRMAEKELRNAELPITRVLGSYEKAEQWVQAYFGATEALKAISGDHKDISA